MVDDGGGVIDESASGGDFRSMWHPIARSDDLAPRHVFQAKLNGREFAVWRADDGFVNVWENRCMHRGVRLSIGLNEGQELRCIYHGWRYSNRTAGCVYIPAHPADAPAQTICNRTFPVVERYGMIWTWDAPAPVEPDRSDGAAVVVPALEQGSAFPLRALPFNAPADYVLGRLRGYQPVGDTSSADEGPVLDQNGERPLSVAAGSAVFFVQPVDGQSCVVRGVLAAAPPDAERLLTLRRHADALTALREVVESEALAERPASTKVSIDLEPVSEVQPPTEAAKPDDGLIRVVVARKWNTADGIIGFELEPVAGELATFQPGAHIDVHLPNGLVRQYSLTNGPGVLDRYVIGVKVEGNSRGGSSCLNDVVREGDVLGVSRPRNNFSLRRDGLRTTLIAGGVGVTPLLSMAKALDANRLAFELHYFVSALDQVAFAEALEPLGNSVRLHVGLSPTETGSKLAEILGERGEAEHVYVCGPGPMLGATRKIATESAWPDDAVHFEYFKNETEIDMSSSFDVSLARSGMTLAVARGETILEVLARNGVGVDSSCEQGACGTCIVPVLEGVPKHQDVYLSKHERELGTRIATCVSRTDSPRLVLDI